MSNNIEHNIKHNIKHNIENYMANGTTGSEIAIIGMAGRFPGAANIDEFWKNLENGVDSVSFLTEEELDALDLDPEIRRNPNYVNARGGVLEKREYFDAAFFDYSPREAEIMDPQVRVLMECAWETLENAGYDTQRYSGSIGLYTGAVDHPYWELLAVYSGKSGELGEFASSYLYNKDFMATQIAYRLNLKGPVIVVQSACSTSLVAVHLACQALLTGECDMALAGGVSINAQKQQGYIYQEGMLMSPEGRCRAFDADAKGIIGGSGAGAVLLKPLEDAVADGDHIYAAVKGSALNNDGTRKIGYTAPSIEGQVEVIKLAHQVAEVEPHTIGFVEAHGTGTILGDPVEFEGLKQAFETDARQFCALGSVKTNLGHLDAAAGAAGIIKTALALYHKIIPPSLHYQRPNPRIDFPNSPFYVNTRQKPWENGKTPRRAGISSFGIGGTNAHIVLEEVPQPSSQPTSQLTSQFTSQLTSQTIPERQSTGEHHHLILLSARTETALDTAALNLAQFLSRTPSINLADAAYTLQTGRRAFGHRKIAVCSDTAEAARILSNLTSRKNKIPPGQKQRPIIFMFPGLGSQYVDMGRELYRQEPVFRSEADRCFQEFDTRINQNLKEILYPSANRKNTGNNEENPMTRFGTAQALIFTVEYALAKLLMSWGIIPHAMIGYSFGEYPAAALSGVLSLEDAVEIIAARGTLIEKTAPGAMLSVPLPIEEIKSQLGPQLSPAIDNGPTIIISGPPQAVEEFENRMKKNKCICMHLQAEHALHSAMMTPIADEFRRKIESVNRNKPRIPYISNLTGSWITPGNTEDPGYWVNHLSRTVKFADGIRELGKEKNAVFLEVGPGRDLSALLQRHIEAHPHQDVINLLRPPQKDISDTRYLLEKIGRLWLWGVEIDWHKFNESEKRHRLPLPTYPFEGKPYWLDHHYLDAIGKKDALPRINNRGEQQPEQLPSPAPTETTWLLLVPEDDCGIPRRLQESLQKTGAVIAVATLVEDDCARLLEQAHRRNIIPHRILHMWGLGLTGTHYQNQHREEERYSYYSLLHLVEALAERDYRGQVTIDILTAAPGESKENRHPLPQTPAAAAQMGLVDAVNRRYPHITCRIINVNRSPTGSPQEALELQRLLNQLGIGLEPEQEPPAANDRPDLMSPYEPPQNPTEETIISIWKQMFGYERIGIQDDFFELGGDSIKAMTVRTKIHKALNVEIPLSEIFKHQTVKLQAHYIMNSEQDTYNAIEPVEEKEFYPLSSAQKRLYVLQHMDRSSVVFNMTNGYVFEGNLEPKRFEEAFTRLVKRHEILRTSFHIVDDSPVQKVEAAAGFSVGFHRSEEKNTRQILRELVKSFDLSRTPLVRVNFIEVTDSLVKNTYYVLFDMHHIVSDALSMELMIAEFAALYSREELKPLTIQYKDYAVWQNQALGHQRLKTQHAYWLKEMENFVFTRLPVDEPNDRDRSIGKDRWVKIDHALGKKIDTFCINHKITKFTYMISIFNLLIALETGQDDITIGIPIAHRDHHDELKQLLGTLLNVLLIRTVIDNDEAFRELLARSENTVVNAIDNSDYPYELLNQELREIYRQDYNELYTIWFNYIPMAGNKEILSDEFNIYPLEMEEFQPRFDVMLYVYDSPGGLSLRLVYNGNLYSEKRMNRILDNYLQTIDHVLENETLTLTEIYRALQPEIADFHLDFEDDYENDDMMF